RVIQHQRVKYACPCCELGIKVTPAPPRIIPRGLFTESALAWMVIRPFVVGRRGWLFADTVAGAHASANLYSLVETCKANGIDPYRYLVWLFQRLPLAATADDYAALLPWAMPTELR
ncbi:transposase domain-containing protein, partial [Burkholderia ubonensis]|uniref:transposase domain-containing protein n=4 Tax=Burkholderia ubonensis TaxID=101571 RepID=UPI000AF23E32